MTLTLAGTLFVWFDYAQGMRARKLAEVVKEKSNQIRQQIDDVEQKSKLQHSNTTDDLVISPSEYQLAQEIFKLFARDRIKSKPHSGSFMVVPETNLVYCLSYERSNAPLPTEFMRAFTNPTPRVITETNELLFSKSGTISDINSEGKGAFDLP